MKTYDLITIGTGSAMTLVQPFLSMHPEARVAVIDRDPPGGICLNTGCIPTKMLVYPAALLRTIADAEALGLSIHVRSIDFEHIMERMRQSVRPDVASLREALSTHHNIDYYPHTARFTGDYRIDTNGTAMTSKRILLCLGSRPIVPSIDGLDTVDYHTSDTILDITERPNRVAIIGGGYIAAEYGHFFSAMGADVTIIARNQRFLPDEEPEISFVAENAMGGHLTILTGHEAVAVASGNTDPVTVTARRTADNGRMTVAADLLLIAAGRRSNADLLSPEAGGIATDTDGWIRVDDHLETTQPGIYALGDAIGRHPFKHAANYEAKVVFYNLVYGEGVRVDYRAVPHAVFTYPEIASVGLGEAEAERIHGRDNIRIGFQRFRDTARGAAMNAGAAFVKVIAKAEDETLLGAHIIGPSASLLIQEIVTVMTAGPATLSAVSDSMHIHPALSEVVEWACASPMPPETYRERFKQDIVSLFVDRPGN